MIIDESKLGTILGDMRSSVAQGPIHKRRVQYWLHLLSKLEDESKGLRFVHHIVRDLDEAHFVTARSIFKHGVIREIDRTIYTRNGQHRKRFRRLEMPIHLKIIHPGLRPLAPSVPVGIAPPATDKTIEQYFVNYLMSSEDCDNETYTYGQYILPQIGPVISLLKSTPNTNQATIAVGDERSIMLSDPPCLRLIDCRIDDGFLNFVLTFRSWDGWSALPTNLGGLQLLKEYMSSMIGCADGSMTVVSKGVHLYDYTWSEALSRLNGNLPENCVLSKEEIEQGEGWRIG